MVKSYLRYRLQKTFGVIFSADSEVLFDWSGRFAITGSLENITIWNLRQGVAVCTFKVPNNTASVTALALSPDKAHIAAGYSDGKVRIWKWKGGKEVDDPLTLRGHRSSVSTLTYSTHTTDNYAEGQLLSSGSNDGKIIIWDVVQQKGLFRLQGHKDQITHTHFLTKSSKDTLVKVWDLETQHCINTVVGHRKEVWGFDINKEETRMYSGTSDNQIRLWSLTYPNDDEETVRKSAPEILLLGQVPRKNKDRIVNIKISPGGGTLACQSFDKKLEFFSIFNDADIKRRKKRRVKRLKEKDSKKAEEFMELEANDYCATDELATQYMLTTSSKIRSFSFALGKPQVILGLSNNQIEVYNLEEKESSKQCEITLPGHSSDIRSLTLSSDNSLLLSTSNETSKIWNVYTMSCIHTLDSGYGLCSAFVPGNRHVIIGTKEGKIELFDVASGELLESVDAHTAELWSLCIRPDQRGFVTGGADKELKFWDFDLKKDQSQRRLTIVHKKTVQMGDDVLCVVYSKDQKFLAASLLDNTVKIFYADTMNFFLSLYGHKLPVLSLDISSDSTLIITASADKNIKLWGLDFGDCHRSLFAHDDSIMQVKFVPQTHYFFSVSKDKTLKYWDGDKYEQILSLQGHHSEVWALAISRDGEFVVTGSHDRSIRIWERTQELVFVDIEKEEQMEKLFESSLEEGAITLDEGQESTLANTKNIETIKAGEKIIEAIELAEHENNRLNQFNSLVNTYGAENASISKPETNPHLIGKSPTEYLLYTIKSIPANDLEQALLTISFTNVLILLRYLDEWIQKGWSVELSCRCLFFMMKMYQYQLTTNRNIAEVLVSLQKNTREMIKNQRDVIGFNKAGMNFLKRYIQQNEEAIFFDFSAKVEEVRKKKKQKLR